MTIQKAIIERNYSVTFENKCLRKLLQVSWTEHKTNEYVRGRIENIAGHEESLVSVVKIRKLLWSSLAWSQLKTQLLVKDNHAGYSAGRKAEDEYS